MTPRPRLILICSFAVPVVIAGLWMPGMRQIAIFYNLVLIGIAIADWIVTPKLHRLDVHREVSESLSVGTNNPVRIHVRNTANESVTVRMVDECPDHGTVHGDTMELTIEPSHERTAKYGFEPHRRGRTEFPAVHISRISRLGFWTFMERREAKSLVKILPDIRAVYRYELLARRNRLDEMGLKMHRIRGQGSDFERLRDYRRGDEVRRIDWKATARMQKLISREYNVERNQNVLIAVDCGRSMLNETEGVTYLDRALNASIMLSYIALGQGDNVGFLAFSSRIERMVKPVRGKPAIQTVLQNSFDLDARREASDYALAMEQLARNFRKRSLVVMVTHVVDEKHLQSISDSMKSIRSPHLFLCVFLTDLGLTHLASRIPKNAVDGFQSGAAAEILTAIERGTAKLKDNGIMTLSALPNKLTPEVINGYLDIKARHLM